MQEKIRCGGREVNGKGRGMRDEFNAKRGRIKDRGWRMARLRIWVGTAEARKTQRRHGTYGPRWLT
jgi:hypothetical protein